MDIPIFFTVDDKYISYIDVAIRSIIKNASNKYNYKINVLYQNLSDEQKQKIKQLADNKENFEIEMVYIENGLESIANRLKDNTVYDYFNSLSIYFRLFIPEIFSQYDKGIYVDSDIVVLGDISELYNIDLGENIIGATRERSVDHIEEFQVYFEDVVGINRKEYFNSGVLLMNLKKMREKELTRNFLRVLNKYNFDTVAPDQDYLNALCYGKILYFDECWNTEPVIGKTQNVKPKLIHYNLFSKPWKYDNVPFQEYFWEYAKESSFYNDIVKFKNNYSEKEKQFDKDCFNYLIEKACKLRRTENYL